MGLVLEDRKASQLPDTLIDLFAGCGGLSLGLEQAGFEPVFVNELHPDAMATYLANRQGLAVATDGNHVHDILELTRSPEALHELAGRLRGEHGEITLVAGGPPCQGYSGIGHRRSFEVDKVEVPSNHLYREMARFIEAVAPKAFLFENVRGLLTARWTPEGDKGEIWEDVKATFSDIEVTVRGEALKYKVDSALVRAREYGVPQNRPRVLLVGIREDIAEGLELDEGAPASGLLPRGGLRPPDPIDLLGDLVDEHWQPGGETKRYPSAAESTIQKQLRRTPQGRTLAKGSLLTEQEYSKHSPRVIAKFDHMIRTGGEIPEEMKTKKFAQRLLPKRWGEAGPTITATSLPDDYVHFSLPRVLTVREWARLQMFPDWYQFVGKRTTGGRRRAGDPSQGNWSRDLPKYTQIGNAVPVGLAAAVGRHLHSLVGDQEASEQKDIASAAA
jgi:DNA (cytosine-5)-methyltransferase 1